MTWSTRAAIVLDLDDTLYLERDYVRSGFAAVGHFISQRCGMTGFGDRCWSHFLNGQRGDIFNRVLAECQLPDSAEAVAELIGVYRSHHPTITLADDAERWLTQNAGQYAFGLITDGPRLCQQHKVDALQLASRIDHILLTDAWGREYWKPHPRAFEEMMHRFNIDAERCFYIGDNPHKDFHAPQSLGWTTIRVRRAEGLHADATHDAIRPDYDILSFDDLDGCLQAHGLSAAPLMRRAG